MSPFTNIAKVTASVALMVAEEMVPRGESLKIIQRNYVVPGSNRGPAPEQVVNPRLIVLKN